MNNNLCIFDIESSGTYHQWSSPIQISGVLVSSDLKELNRFDFRSRLPEGEIPMASSLLVNNISLDVLTKTNMSLYQMLGQIEETCKKFSGSIFLGWGNTEFDDSMISNALFRNLRYPYIMNTSPNRRHDGLKITQGAYSVDNNILKTENTKKGNVSLSLPLVAKNNGIKFEGAHSAIFDSLMVLQVLSIVKKKQPHTWEQFLKTSSKVDAETIIRKENILTLKEVHYGKFFTFLVSPLNSKSCINPYNKCGVCIDLKFNIEPLLNLSVSELKMEMKKKKFLRQIRLNKGPIFLDSSYGYKEEPYSAIDPELIKKRAEMIKNNENFNDNLLSVLREIYEEKKQTKSQEHPFDEETILKFPSPKDNRLFPIWHAASWKDKFKMLDNFQDDRLIRLGQKIIFQESPDSLPPDDLKNIKMEIAKKILSENQEKWHTCKEFYFECDNLREKHKDDEKKLKVLDELNEYVMSVQRKYENV